MKKFILIVAFVSVAAPSPALAGEKDIFAWDNPKTAEIISNILVYSQIGLDTWDTVKSENKTQAVKCQAIRYAVNFGTNELVKYVFHRERPDMSDNNSFYSMHASGAAVASGWKLYVGVPLAIGAGYFRMAADKHYLTDVAVGLASGFLSQQLCDKTKGLSDEVQLQ